MRIPLPPSAGPSTKARPLALSRSYIYVVDCSPFVSQRLPHLRQSASRSLCSSRRSNSACTRSRIAARTKLTSQGHFVTNNRFPLNRHSTPSLPLSTRSNPLEALPWPRPHSLLPPPAAIQTPTRRVQTLAPTGQYSRPSIPTTRHQHLHVCRVACNCIRNVTETPKPRHASLFGR